MSCCLVESVVEGSWGVGVTNIGGGDGVVKRGDWGVVMVSAMGGGVEVTSLVLVGSVEGRDGDGLEGMEGSPARGSLVSVSISHSIQP